MSADPSTTTPALPPLPAGPFLFVSYASADRGRVLAIADELRAAGLELWIDQAGIAGGTSYGTEIANALKGSAAVALMCSAASLASRNVRQEIMLAWRYDRPILPLLLEPTTFPDDVAYWLEGAQWIEILDRSPDTWLPNIGRALARHGLTLHQPVPSVPSHEQASGSALAPDYPTNLPVPDAPIVGREREIDELLTLLKHSRWVTLTGPGGTGKTRLATEVARRAAGDFPDGAWLVDLAPVAEPQRVLPALAAALEVAEEAGRSPAETLVAALADRRVLLLLDNMEQIAAAAPTVAAITNACAGVVVIATSRLPLQTAGEWVYAVGQLELPNLAPLPPLPVLGQNPAVRLFVERAREARRDFTLADANGRSIAEICHRLDGLPLAIELAAARVRLLPPAAILTRLGSRLNLLTRGTALAARQQTLRDTIAWSYGLLSPTEQTAFRGLAVFAGGATVEAAESVFAATGDGTSPSLDDVSALLDHSLLRSEGAGADDLPRIRMLETIREYAAEQLEQHGETQTARRAHAAYYLEKTLALESDLIGKLPGPAFATLRADDGNLGLALEWLGDHPAETPMPAAELRLAAALTVYWRKMGQFGQGRQALDAALSRHPDGDPGTRARALEGSAFMAGRQGDNGTAIALLHQALDIRRERDDRDAEARSLLDLAEAHTSRGDFARARELLTEVLVIRRALDDQPGVAVALHELGMTSLYEGLPAEAITSLREAMPIYRLAGDARNIGLALNDLAVAEMLTGDPAAIDHLDESLALWRTLADDHAVAWTLVNSGRALQLAGRVAEATPRLEQAIDRFREMGQPNGVGLARYALGLIALASDDLATALTQLAESLRLAHQTSDPWHIAERLEALAMVRVAQNRAHDAARLFGAAARLREEGHMPVPPAEQADHDRALAVVKQALGPDADGAIAEGGVCGVDEIVREALGAG